MSDTPNKFYLTTPIYYVNARPHIGHAYTTIAADVIARRHRLLGHDTYFLTGTDEHGQKIQRSAEAAGIPPQQFTDEVSASFQNLWKRMGITNDKFIRTTDEAHKRGAQQLFTQLQQNGFIELRSYTGQYCISDETFVDVPVGAPCPECGRITETVTEENYFFKLSQFQKPLIDLIESNTLTIQPDSRKNEVLSFLRGNVSSSEQSRVPHLRDGLIVAKVGEAPQNSTETPEPGAPSMPELHPGMGGSVELSTTGTPYVPGAPFMPESHPGMGGSVELSTTGTPYVPGAPFMPESHPGMGGSVELSTTGTPHVPGAPFMPESHPGMGGNVERSTAGTPYVPGALKDLSISRTSVKWGIPVPGDEKHVIYVWLDALSNYMTAIGYGAENRTDLTEEEKKQEQAKFKKYWPADLHLVGKEIIRFHCVYWPAFLLALNPELAGKAPDDLPFEDHLKWAKDWLPKAITAHGWLLFEESKMSKSRGNIVRTETILDAFGTLLPTPASTSSSETVLQSEESRVPHLRGGLIAAKVGEPPPTPSEAAKPGAPRPAFGTWEEASPTSASLGAPSAESQEPAASEPLAVPQASVSLKDTASAVPQEPAASAASALPPTSVSIKGTASAVPQEPAASAALAAEVRLSSPPARVWKHEQDLFAADVLRYFLLREIPFGQDGSFSFDALWQRYNSDLTNGYGNLVSRTLSMISQYCSGTIPSVPKSIFEDIDSERVEQRVSKQGIMQHPVVDESYVKATLRIARNTDENAFAKYDFFRIADSLAIAVGATDAYLSAQTPWKLAKLNDPFSQRQLHDTLYIAAESIRIITALLYPILPYATSKVWAQLGLGDIQLASDNGELRTLTWGGLKPGTKLGPLSPIFPRAPKELIQLMNDMEASNATKPEGLKSVKPSKSVVENAGLPLINNNNDAGPHHRTEFAESPISSESATASLNPLAETLHPISAHHLEEAEPRPETPQIAIDDFIKIDLRVAQIVVAERIPKADKLLRLEVDLGYERRQILSGIAPWYTPEELIGRRIVVIANLAPRKMRGLESHGMLLAASQGDDGKPVLATFGEDIALGSRLK